MKRYLNYFKIPFIITAVVVVVCVAVKLFAKPAVSRNNSQTDLSQNVFDYADNLTDAMENQLENLIAETEEKTGIDIAVVFLNESLADSGLEGGYSSRSGKYDMWVKGYAEAFYNAHSMGYEKPYGSGLVFVDNCFREPTTGRVDSWITAYGEAGNRISNSDCESIMDVALIDLDDYSTAEDYYRAYSRVVELIPRYYSSNAAALEVLKPSYIVVFAFVVAAIYVIASWKSKAGKKTTTGITYVTAGRPNVKRKQDAFIRKSVSKVRIQSSSGGGGGGHSGGGHSGGGHSR